MVLATPTSFLPGFRLAAHPGSTILPDSVILPQKAASPRRPPLGDWPHQGPWVETSFNWLVRGKFERIVGGPYLHWQAWTTTAPPGSLLEIVLPLVVAEGITPMRSMAL